MNADNNKNGVEKFKYSETEAFDALIPKIRIGTERGITKIVSKIPLRLIVAKIAAPIAPASVSAGVPTKSVRSIAPNVIGVRLRKMASIGVINISGKLETVHWAAHLTKTTNSSGISDILIKSMDPSC